MANTQIGGFRPAYCKGGGGVEHIKRRVLSNNTNAIRCFDALVIDSSGDTIRSASAATAVATVAVGASYLNAAGARVEAAALPGSTTYSGTDVENFDQSNVYVIADPVNVVFKASCDEALAQTDTGLNYQMVLGSTTTKYSDQELDATSRATDATIPWRLIDFVRGDARSDPDLADAALLVQINAGMIDPALSDYTGT